MTNEKERAEGSGGGGGGFYMESSDGVRSDDRTWKI